MNRGDLEGIEVGLSYDLAALRRKESGKFPARGNVIDPAVAVSYRRDLRPRRHGAGSVSKIAFRVR